MDFTTPEVLSRKNDSPLALTEFIEKFNQEENAYFKVVDLGFFMEKYMERFDEIEESERTLFFEFVSRISELLDDISGYDNHVKNEIFEKETKLQCYDFIMGAMKKCLESAKTIPEDLSVLQSSLILLYKGYNHCKECESIYGDLLEHFKNPLASFFNTMLEFQDPLRNKFLKIFDSKLHSDWFPLLRPIICELNKLCELVFILDYTTGMHLYKTLIRVFETYENVGYTDLQIEPILNGLFSEIKDIGNEFKLEIKNANEVLDHESRMFLFKLNVLKKILKMFPTFIRENLQSSIHLILHLYELLISCYHKFPEENTGRYLKKILVENINPMLSLFYSEKLFQTSILLLNSKEIPSDLQMAHFLLKLSALNFLSSPDHDKLPERINVVQNIFLMLGENTARDDMLLTSLNLPLSLLNSSKQILAFHQSSQSGPEPESITLYHHAYLHICEYSKGISDSELPNLEYFVVDFLKRNSSIPSSLLISDIWIYRLRSSSVENLFTRCVSFSHKLSDLPSNSVAKLLFKRMVKFLPLNLKETLIEQDEQLKVLFSDQDKILHQYGAPHLNKNSQIDENNVSGNISALLDELTKQYSTDNEQVVRKVCLILELCAVSINALEIQEFLRLTEFATLMFNFDIYEIQIAVLTFLRALNFKKFNDKDPLFAKIRSSIAVLYNEALKSKNYVVRLEAYSIFHIMAQYTEIRITQETIAKFPALYPGVKAHLTETPESGFITPKDKNELLEKQVASIDNKPEESSNLLEQSKELLSLFKLS